MIWTGMHRAVPSTSLLVGRADPVESAAIDGHIGYSVFAHQA